jgi:CO/xanthine dehydrogenase FAD-binding subunit
LVGRSLADAEAAIAQAAGIAQAAARPIDDMRGTVAQRKHLAAVLTRRALRIAVERVELGLAGAKR